MTAIYSELSRPQSVVLSSSVERLRIPEPSIKSLAVGVALALLPLHWAAAQDQPASQNGPEEITVTGSRIHQNQDYASPNPISTFDAQKMESLGLVNMSDVITQVPQNVSQFQAATTGGSAFFMALAGRGDARCLGT